MHLLDFRHVEALEPTDMRFQIDLAAIIGQHREFDDRVDSVVYPADHQACPLGADEELVKIEVRHLDSLLGQLSEGRGARSPSARVAVCFKMAVGRCRKAISHGLLQIGILLQRPLGFENFYPFGSDLSSTGNGYYRAAFTSWVFYPGFV
jgi:hypothetical protein